MDSHGAIRERVFGLPLSASDAFALVGPDFWAPHPLFAVGVLTDADGRPVAGAEPVLSNLYAAGGLLAGAERWCEKSGDGIAVASAVRAADAIIEGSAA